MPNIPDHPRNCNPFPPLVSPSGPLARQLDLAGARADYFSEQAEYHEQHMRACQKLAARYEHQRQMIARRIFRGVQP